MEYTPHHKIILKIPTIEPEIITEKLQAVDFLLSPIGDVLTVKACDFCDGEKEIHSLCRRTHRTWWN